MRWPYSRNFLLVLAMLSMALIFGLAACENSDAGNSSRERVLERQAEDYRALADRYIACEGRTTRLEQDFEAFQRALDRYQISPTEANQTSYLLLRKSVELQLEEVC